MKGTNLTKFASSALWFEDNDDSDNEVTYDYNNNNNDIIGINKF